TQNPFTRILKTLEKPGDGEYGKYYSLPSLNDSRIDRLPFSIRILLESAIRNCDEFQVTVKDVDKILDWQNTSPKKVEIPFKPARVLLQDATPGNEGSSSDGESEGGHDEEAAVTPIRQGSSRVKKQPAWMKDYHTNFAEEDMMALYSALDDHDFTGVPTIVDLAGMRNAMHKLGGDPSKINPLVPVDLVIDHSVQVDVSRSENALQANIEIELERNKERYSFLKWGAIAFDNMLVVPPELGLFTRVIFNTDDMLYSDTVFGTDSHTSMINGLGVAGWGVGGIEAEAAMLGQAMSMVLPGVVGFELSGSLKDGVTATDLVLTVAKMLRQHGVVGNFVEFYGKGMSEISLPDRANIANMSPEYGATMGFFPVDHVTLQYLKMTGRSDNTVKPWIKTSLGPGSRVVTKYLEKSGLLRYLQQLGFHIVGYGCTTCIGNSGDLDEPVASAIADNDIVAVAVLSGKRNFEGRIHPLTRANYLASPPIVVAYALAGTVDIDFETEPIGLGKNKMKIFLRDIWPSSEEVAEIVQSNLLPGMFKSVYETITEGHPTWNELHLPSSRLYVWDPNSTYIHEPPNLKDISMSPPGPQSVNDAYYLVNLGDSITTDHISPGGNIHKDSPAAKYLMELGVDRKDFNSYGSRRGNDEVMVRGTFANIRLVNKLLEGEVGPKTIHTPSGEKLSVYDAAMGVKAVIAKSFERIHRSNLVGMGIIPLCFQPGEDADTLELTGYE
ncbi:hypothetical protein M8C21_008417, partial [Ambrosia artemisiifolia]